MERHNESKEQGKTVLPVPIKTYKWEDVRRARLRGGYPWTYLYKDPFDEILNPQENTMDSMKKSRSSTTMGKEGVEIKELTASETELNRVESSGQNLGIVTEATNGNSAECLKTARTSSLVIQEQEEEKEKPEEEKEKPKDDNGMFYLESAESSDNISQYLDKDERNEAKTGSQLLDVPGTSKTNDKTRKERAKSEEPVKRKRKLSIESAYSRISQSKLSIMKKLKEMKEKIKIPKISLSTPDLIKNLTMSDEDKEKAKEEALAKEFEKEQSKKSKKQTKKNEKPVYIHIPLKPPPGETDEFSYLEFGEKKPIVEETKPKTPEPVEEQPPIQIESPRLMESRPSIDNPDEIVAIEIVKSEAINLDEGEEFEAGIDDQLDTNDIFILEKDPKKEDSEDVIIILSDSKEPPKLSRAASMKLAQSIRKHRAKSAEPERKRKTSIESSYSRISLPKSGLLKKLKDAKDKFKFPKISLSRSNSKKEKSKEEDEKIKDEEPKKEETKKVEKKTEKSKNVVPQYIHIPLKPPPGETDEFSHLEFENKEESEPPKPAEKLVEEQQSSIDSPMQDNQVQFIYLTPPSDDEILDQSEIPETPSSDGSRFFDRVDELKELAKGAVDKISTQNKIKLETVTEETDKNAAKEECQKEEESSKLVQIENTEAPKAIEKELDKDETQTEEKKVEDVEEQKENVIPVDEDAEDGLKLTETKSEEIKSSIKNREGSPTLKKKVSFKRPSKGDLKETVTNSAEETADNEEKNDKLPVLGPSQSMSVDEEKTYLDDKIIKSTSLEEDYNKWSKISDHEYEPVNPPSNEPPQALETNEPVDDAPKPEDYTPQELQDQLEDRYFNQTPQITITDREPIDAIPPPTENKFQKAFKEQTGKLKDKFHNMKRPSLTLPKAPKITKPNMDKFKINLPKIPDTTKITLPTWTLPHRKKTTTTITTTTTKTEKVPEKSKSKFTSFTLPRRKKNNSSTNKSLKQRQYSTESNAGDTKKKFFDFSTYPRIFSKKSKKDEFDSASLKDGSYIEESKPEENWKQEVEQQVEDDREDSVERRMAAASRIQYVEDIGEVDDAFERENQEIHRASPFSSNYNPRWEHGNFYPEGETKVTDLDDLPRFSHLPGGLPKDAQSSESSLGIHRRGVLEEIDSDEFFLRQKGISQDDINVGSYLSSEIREAFKSPTNALMQIEDEPIEEPVKEIQHVKRKSKSKRKKTPHVSQEQIGYADEDETEPDDLSDDTPSRPKRRSKKSKKDKFIPYQEVIHVERDRNVSNAYENEQMEGREQPEIEITNPYRNVQYESEENLAEEPEVPPRKHRSLKSLMDEYNFDESTGTPIKPPRSLSKGSLVSGVDTPQRPYRTRSQSRTTSQFDEDNSSLLSANRSPCIEEPCQRQLCDYMGYAVVDKSQIKDPPLPPRRKKSTPSLQSSTSEVRYFTVPRNSGRESPPLRPLRNYSTLGPSRPPRKKHIANLTDEEKESIDITQYIEIEDENGRDLQSGEIIKKMRERPLPAPPRPPRKPRSVTTGSSLSELAHIDETEVSTQTEPLPDDVIFDDIRQDASDRVVMPTIERRLITPTHYTHEETVTHASLVVQPLDGARILPDSEMSHEHRIPITKDYDETSEIPEDFKKLKDPSEVEVLKTQKLQVSDLDIDRLTVNELLANKIIVSEIDSSTIQATEINPAPGGALRIGEIELPPGVVQQLLDKIQGQMSSNTEQKDENSEQKKTPIEHRPDVQRIDSREEKESPPTSDEPMVPIERRSDEEPPPRPPEPRYDYFPSQPPASFYALRAHKLVEDTYGHENIPTVPRRRRHHKPAPPITTSTDEESPARPPSRRRYRSPEPTIPEMSVRLAQACGTAVDGTLRRLITHITQNVLRNTDGHQDLHVVVIILLILIAGLILLRGDTKTIHYHHWEYFNPPRDL